MNIDKTDFYNNKLYKKMQEELDAFISDWKSKPSADTVELAYGTLRPFSLRWPKSAIISNMDCLIQNSTAYRKPRTSVYCRLSTF